jgi:hypothetical protein
MKIVLLYSALCVSTCSTITPEERSAALNLGFRMLEARIIPAEKSGK